jgi:hypothetical protein
MVKQLDGRLEILGGSDDDRRQAREWMGTFLNPGPFLDSRRF